MQVLTISNTVCSLDMKNPGLGPKSIQSFQISANCVSYSRKRPNPIAAGELFCRLGLHHFVHLHLGMCFWSWAVSIATPL